MTYWLSILAVVVVVGLLLAALFGPSIQRNRKRHQ